MDTCPTCNKEIKEGKGYAYWSGKWFCSKKCYETPGIIFDTCPICGKWNSSVVVNLKYRNEKICDECYDKREGLATVTIIFKH